jgi:L-fucose mutarotase/ribose pyranase (RbsD/FucU family)
MKIKKENFTGDIAVPEKRLNEFDYSKAEIDYQANQEVLRLEIIENTVSSLLEYAKNFYNNLISESELAIKAKTVLDNISCPQDKCNDLIKWLTIYKPSRHKLLKGKLTKELSTIVKEVSIYTEKLNYYNPSIDSPIIKINNTDLKTIIDQIAKFIETHNTDNLDVVYVVDNNSNNTFDSLVDLTQFLTNKLKDNLYNITTIGTNQAYNKKHKVFCIDINTSPTLKNSIEKDIRSFEESARETKLMVSNPNSEKLFSFQSKNRVITIEGFEHDEAQKIAIKLMAPLENLIDLPEGEYKLSFKDLNK